MTQKFLKQVHFLADDNLSMLWSPQYDPFWCSGGTNGLTDFTMCVKYFLCNTNKGCILPIVPSYPYPNYWQYSLESFQKLFGTNSRTRIYSQFHFTDLLINFLHEIYDEVNQFVLIHLFCVKISYQETDVISVHRFPPQDDEILCPHHHETHELFTQDFLDLISLFNHYAHSYRVYR